MCVFCVFCGAYLSLLLVEVIDDDTNEEVEGEEGAEDDEDNEVQVHVKVNLFDWLLLHLAETHRSVGKLSAHLYLRSLQIYSHITS